MAGQGANQILIDLIFIQKQSDGDFSYASQSLPRARSFGGEIEKTAVAVFPGPPLRLRDRQNGRTYRDFIICLVPRDGFLNPGSLGLVPCVCAQNAGQREKEACIRPAGGKMQKNEKEVLRNRAGVARMGVALSWLVLLCFIRCSLRFPR